jgi:hypothetical protein
MTARPSAKSASVPAAGEVLLNLQWFKSSSWLCEVTHCLYSICQELYSFVVAYGCGAPHHDARLCAKRLEVFADTFLIKTHVRILKGRSTDLSDYPPEKTALYQQAPLWCRTQASIHGPATAAVIDELLGVNATHRLRSCQGILRLAEKPVVCRLEAACHRALQVGDPSYRTIKDILVAGTETAREPALQPRSDPADRRGGLVMTRPHQLEQTLRTLKLSGMLDTLDISRA